MPVRAKSFSAARGFRRFKWRPEAGMKGDIPEGRLLNSSRRQLSPAGLPVPALPGFPLLLFHSSGSVPGAGSVSCCPPCGRLGASQPRRKLSGDSRELEQVSRHGERLCTGRGSRTPGRHGTQDVSQQDPTFWHSTATAELKCLEQRGLSPTLCVHLRFVPKPTSAVLGAEGFPSPCPEPALLLHLSASRG